MMAHGRRRRASRPRGRPLAGGATGSIAGPCPSTRLDLRGQDRPLRRRTCRARPTPGATCARRWPRSWPGCAPRATPRCGELTARFDGADARGPGASSDGEAAAALARVDRPAAPGARGGVGDGSAPTTPSSRRRRPTSSTAGCGCSTWCARWSGPAATRRAVGPATRRRCSCAPPRPAWPGSAELVLCVPPGPDGAGRRRHPGGGGHRRRRRGLPGGRRPGHRGHGLRHRDDPPGGRGGAGRATATWPRPSARCRGRSAWPRPSPAPPRWWWWPRPDTPARAGRRRPRRPGRARPRRAGLAGDLVAGEGRRGRGRGGPPGGAPRPGGPTSRPPWPRGGYTCLVDGPEAAMAVANVVAPEHLELLFDGAEDLLPLVRAAGAVFFGPWSPASLGDYLAGPNHVLPTNRTARFASALRADDFRRHIHAVSADPEALAALGPPRRHPGHHRGAARPRRVDPAAARERGSSPLRPDLAALDGLPLAAGGAAGAAQHQRVALPAAGDLARTTWRPRSSGSSSTATPTARPPSCGRRWPSCTGSTPRRSSAPTGPTRSCSACCSAFGGPGRRALLFEPTYALHRHIARLTGTAVVAGGRGPDFRIDAAEADEPAGRHTAGDHLPLLAQQPDRAPPSGPRWWPGSPTRRPGWWWWTRPTASSPGPRPWSCGRPDRAGAGRGAHLLQDLGHGRLPARLPGGRPRRGGRLRGGGPALPPVGLQPGRRRAGPALPPRDGGPGGGRGRRARPAVGRRWRTWRWSGGRRTPTSSSSARPGARRRRCGRASWTAGVLVRDCSSWDGLAGCLRVTVGTPAENDRFLEALGRSLGAAR